MCDQAASSSQSSSYPRRPSSRSSSPTLVEYHDDVVEVALVAGDEAVTVLLYVPVHVDAIRLAERRTPSKDDGVNRTQSAANPGGAVQSMTWLTVNR